VPAATPTARRRTLELVCFACDLPLRQTEREGVEIDYCPTCRSIWLDRGELEKLVNRLGTWFPETDAGFERHWDDDVDRLGPSSRLDEIFDVR